MKAKHRKIIAELCDYCNQLGSSLDGTSTSIAKYVDRQKAHAQVYTILYAILSDHPENDHADYEWELAQEALAKIKDLTQKRYADRQGNF